MIRFGVAKLAVLTIRTLTGGNAMRTFYGCLVVLAASACSYEGGNGSSPDSPAPPVLVKPVGLIPPASVGAAPSTFVPPAAQPTFDPLPAREPFNPNGVTGGRPPRPIPGL